MQCFANNMAWWAIPIISIDAAFHGWFHLLLLRQSRVNVRFRQHVRRRLLLLPKPYVCMSCLRLLAQGELYSGLMARFRLVSISFRSFDKPPEASETFSASPGQPHPAPIERQYHLAREINVCQSRGRVSIKRQNKIRKGVSREERRGPDVLRWILQARTA